MTKRRSTPFKVSKPATPALEKAITECVLELKRRKVVVKKVHMVVKSVVSGGYKETEIIDGIKGLANAGKLRVGSSKRTRISTKPQKTFGERTVNLPTADKEVEKTETDPNDDKAE